MYDFLASCIKQFHDWTSLPNKLQQTPKKTGTAKDRKDTFAPPSHLHIKYPSAKGSNRKRFPVPLSGAAANLCKLQSSNVPNES